MKTKSLRGTGSASAPLFDPRDERMANVKGSGNPPTLKPKRARVVARSKGQRKPFVDGIVNGERVLIAQPRELERGLMMRIRVALATCGGVLVWRNEVGKARRLSDGQIIPMGLGVGSADLIAIVAPYGRLLGVEVKRPKVGRVSPEQQRWMKVVRTYGGVAGVATTVEEALALVDEARRPVEVP